MCKKLMLVAMLSLSFAAMAKTTMWKAPGGGLLTDAANWDNGVPVAGDTAWLLPAGAGCVFTNDSPDFAVGTLWCSNTVDATVAAEIRGEKMTLSALYSECRLFVYTPIESSGNLQVANRQNQTARTFFYGDVTVGKNLVLYSLNNNSQAVAAPVFYGSVSVLNGEVTNAGNAAGTFSGPLTAKRVYAGIYWTGANVVFETGSIKVDDMDICAATYNFNKANALDPSTVFTWDASKFFAGGNGATGKYGINADQTIDRIHGEQLPIPSGKSWDDYYQVGVTSGSGKTLTLKSTADDLAYCRFSDGLNLVYAPTDDYTQVFSNSVHTMTGSITVKGGTLKFNGATSLKKVPTVTVSGGTFEIDTSIANPLAALKTLTVCSNATFKASGFTGQLGASSLTTCTIEGGGALHLPSGVTLSATFLIVCGVTPVPGTYTGKGYGTASATECDWIVGGGQVTVANDGYTSWASPVSGSWSDATKWTAGLPTSSSKVYVAAEGADYTVTVDGDQMPASLTVGNLATNTTKVEVASAEFTNCRVTIGRGAFVDVPTGGELVYNGPSDGGTAVNPSADPFVICGGGLLRVSGGTLDVKKMLGYFNIGGYDDSKGTLAVTAGTFRYNRNNNLNRICINKGGLLDISGTGVFYPEGWGCVIGKTGEGAEPGIVFRDSGSLSDSAVSKITGQGDTAYAVSSQIFSGTREEFLLAPYFNCGYAYEVTETQKLVFDLTNATISVGKGLVRVAGDNSDGNVYNAIDTTAIFNLWNGAAFSMQGSSSPGQHFGGLALGYGAFCYVTSHKNTYGEVNIHAGASFTNLYGNTAIGVCHGSGLLSVDGGTFEHKATDRLFIVGLCGGTGSCVVKDGALSVDSPAYVGGVGTNMLYAGTYLSNWSWMPDNHTAVGTFRQEGGDVSFTQPLMVGVDGTGALEEIGSAGTFAAQSLVLSNSVYNAEAGGTVKFVLDGAGVRPLKLTEKLVIGANAKLAVDTSAYPANGGSVPLIRAPGGVEGTFSDVTLTGAFAEKAKLVYRPNGVRLVVPTGIAIVVR